MGINSYWIFAPSDGDQGKRVRRAWFLFLGFVFGSVGKPLKKPK
jgi:hypothetical protein